MKLLDKGLVICITGHSLQHLKEHGHYESMKTVMLDDRMFDRVKEKDIIILDSTTKLHMENRLANWDKHLTTAFKAGSAL
jgi:NAD(P)H dehydrogenase (quinone)